MKRRVQDEATVAGEVFTAADTDKDGRLSAQEFGAMLQNTGFEWSWGPKRTEMLLGALDEDGDSSLDLNEFSKGLEQLVDVAEALLEQQHPSTHICDGCSYKWERPVLDDAIYLFTECEHHEGEREVLMDKLESAQQGGEVIN